MAIWHWEDNRYKQERILLLASLVALVVAPALLLWLYLSDDQHSVASASEPRPTYAEKVPPMEAAAAEQARKLKLESWQKDLDAAIAAGQVAKADTTAQNILKEKPGDAETWSKMGWVWEKKGDAPQALAAYDKAVSLSQTRRAFYLYQKACLLRQGGDFPAAIAALQEAVRLHPGSAEASNMLLIFQLQAGQDQAVRDALRSYGAIDLDSQKVMCQLAAAALAMSEDRPDDARTALSDFQDRIPFDIYRIMTADAFFDAYRSRPEYLVYLLNSSATQTSHTFAP